MTRTDDEDLYADLGLTRQATHADIVHAYRVLLRQHHPDTRTHRGPALAPSGDEVLHRALTAYAVLSNPARRAGYDHQQRSGQSRQEPQTGAQPAPSAATTAPGPSPRPGQPPIRVGPVQWHRPT